MAPQGVRLFSQYKIYSSLGGLLLHPTSLRLKSILIAIKTPNLKLNILSTEIANRQCQV